MTGRTSIANFLFKGNSGNRRSDTMWQRRCWVWDTCEGGSRCKLFSCWTMCLGCCPNWVSVTTTVSTHETFNAIVSRLCDRFTVKGIEKSLQTQPSSCMSAVLHWDLELLHEWRLILVGRSSFKVPFNDSIEKNGERVRDLYECGSSVMF